MLINLLSYRFMTYSYVSRLGREARLDSQLYAPLNTPGAHARDYLVQAPDRCAGIHRASGCLGCVAGHGREPPQDEAASRVRP